MCLLQLVVNIRLNVYLNVISTSRTNDCEVNPYNYSQIDSKLQCQYFANYLKLGFAV